VASTHWTRSRLSDKQPSVFESRWALLIYFQSFTTMWRELLLGPAKACLDDRVPLPSATREQWAATHASFRALSTIDNADHPPAGLFVHRAFALDASRHLAIGRRYPSILARPDRWVSWWWGAVPAGLRLIHRLRPQALWSTSLSPPRI
jgi:hypothetical protein